MAKRRGRRTPNAPTEIAPPVDGNFSAEPNLTGRYLVLFREGATSEAKAMLSSKAGVRNMAMSSDFDGHAFDVESVNDSGALFLEKIGVAVVNADPRQHEVLIAAAESTDDLIMAVEAEQIMYAMGMGLFAEGNDSENQPGRSADYIRGFQDGVNAVCSRVLPGSGARSFGNDDLFAEAAFADNAQATWGLQATKAFGSRASGQNIRVAVLDTGLDLQHPDFRGRAITSQSFVAGQAVQDGAGHGTHCIGTSCGPAQPPVGRRYGCAHQAKIFVGKVLSNQGSGADQGILAGINWAIANQCRVISMSLGAATQPGDPPSQVYETLARRALTSGTLIIAAAGNESRRSQGIIRPVGRPANCPSIMAVAAVDSRLNIADFSCRGINSNGGQVDIAGPGVGVYSTWPMNQRYNTISGTSMATPHVAGIAAMISQITGLTGAGLWQRLVATARRLPLPSADVGAGLVQAP